MPTRHVDELGLRETDPFAEIAHEREIAATESSSERFDRLAFAERALRLVRPPHTTVALCEGRTRVKVEAGRAWGRGDGERWAVLSVPPTASKRAIAVAVAGLAGATREPYVLDVLLGELAVARAE